jgi:aldose 1-epimerase
MVAATGEQVRIEADRYVAVLTQGGATLRCLEYAGRPLVDGFAAQEIPTGGRGQLLAPWVNRIGDGRYDFEGTTHQLPISEPARHNASHGLVRWTAWTLAARDRASATWTYRLMAQSGYPWTLDLSVTYRLDEAGLSVTQRATNLAPTAAPYAAGAHPYLAVGDQVESLELQLPARVQMTTDERKLPTGLVEVAGTAYDFRAPRPIRDTRWDHAVTDLERSADGYCWVTLRDPATGRGVALWADRHHPWLQIYTGDESPATARRSVAVEPMTAPPDAFRTGLDLLRLAPAGSAGDSFAASWGIRALGD